MNTVFGRLMWAACLRRASALEAFREAHADHYPGVHTETMVDDLFTQHAACSCGAKATFTVVVAVDVRAVAK